jgi:hypothetical protein
MVGRVIGKSGETIKALQTYTGALIQIDQTVEPTKVTISGTPHSLSLAVSMVTDIVKGTFKGFALLRQITNPGGVVRAPPLPTPVAQPRPVYAPGYGLIPPSQVRAAQGPGCAGCCSTRLIGAIVRPHDPHRLQQDQGAGTGLVGGCHAPIRAPADAWPGNQIPSSPLASAGRPRNHSTL